MPGLLNALRRYYRSILDLREEAQIARLTRDPAILLTREELPRILNLRHLRGEGAEIGVQRATFSTLLLENWFGQRLHSIDPWRSFEDPDYIDRANASDATHDRFFQMATDRLEKFGDRSKIHRKTSAEAAPDFADQSLDFVYIDAQHHYEAVVEDLALWAPKVRPGGILAGHDYLDGEFRGDRFGVKQAVDEYAQEHGLSVNVTLEPDYPSWFIALPPRASL